MRPESIPTNEISQLMAENRADDLRQMLPDMHPADVADVLARMDEDQQPVLYRLLDREQGLEVFEQLDEEQQAVLLESLSKEQVAAVVPHLPPDDQADLMTTLPEAVAERLLALLPPQARAEVRRLMAYPEDTAGALMTTEFATLPPDIKVHEALDRLREIAPSKETILYSYVVDRVGRLTGIASLEDLVLAPADSTVHDIMETSVISVRSDEDGEDVAQAIQKYDLVAMPVVNNVGILVGMITVDDVLDFIEEEQTEDMYHFGAAGQPVHHYLQIAPFVISRKRVGWLIALVFAGFISAALLDYFKGAFDPGMAITIACFVPMLLASGGNAGTQSAAVITRSLATGELTPSHVFEVLRKEVAIGLTNGAVMGVIACLLSLIIAKDMRLALVVASSMVAAVSLATSMGGLLPLLFERINLDPAYVSGPAIASIVDITTLCIYFAIAHLFLSI